jgi:AAA+ ATPase superfamily predicted ATPase/cold shock CspA family protein/Tfp pilus assembly protein PilF
LQKAKVIIMSDKSQNNRQHTGTISIYSSKEGHGYINPDDSDILGDTIIVHYKSFLGTDEGIKQGDRVVFSTYDTKSGLCAKEVRLIPKDLESSSKQISTEYKTQETKVDYLAQALLARDKKRYEDAAKLYEQGLKHNPSLQLILSYAAMEKNRGRKTQAMQIYQQGIKLVPNSAKLREDAGILAASLNQPVKAIDFLKQALEISKRGNKGQKGILLGLAKVYYQMDTLSSLEEAVKYYEKAKDAFGPGHRQSMPQKDMLMMNIAKIRTQHHRGNLTLQFFKNNQFPIKQARLLEQTTVGADIIVRLENTEMIESYALSKELLVRCLFKSDVAYSDLESLDQAVKKAAATGLADEQVALMVVASLSDSLQRTLFRRIEEPERDAPAIIPIPQSTIESSEDASSILRNIFDQWLYRRDLFAINFPVVGRKFFGRGKLLSEIRNSIATGMPMGIFGLRKVGKTSLLKEIELRSTEFGDIVVYMDLLRVPSDVSNVRWIYWRLADLLYERVKKTTLPSFRWKFGGQFDNFLDVPADFPVATAFDADLTSIFKVIKKGITDPKPKVVILLDEIERLLPTSLGKEGFVGFFDFFSYLRGVTQENNNFVVIVTGANASISEEAQFNGRDNPVFNFFKETYIQLLELSEVSTMLKELGKGMGIRFSQDAIELIYSLTGGHPFFARQLCSFVASRFADRPLQVNSKNVNDLIDQYLEYSGKDFSEIMSRLDRDYPNERDACISLAKAGGSLPIDKLLETNSNEKVNLKHLNGYQMIRIQDDQVSLSMDLLRRWIIKDFFA